MAAIALDGPRWTTASGRPARQLVILLHGLGSDGADIGVLAPIFAKALPHAAFVAPNAPFFQEGEPPSRQWFGIGDIPVAELHAGIDAASRCLDAFIAAEAARLKLLPRSVALVGFSQGAMLALYNGLRRDPGPGALLAYAGALVADTKLESELRWRPPVLLVHGTDDAIITPGYSQSAEKLLCEHAVPVRALFRRGMAHTIDTECIGAGAAFLADWAEGKLVAAAPRPASVS
jgi:phospholipase/carboxylesterase